MKEIKIKLSKWLLRKAVKWSEIQPLDFYRMFSNEIDAKQIEEAKEHFGKFNYIRKLGIRRISDDIQQIDPLAIKFIENN